MMKSINFLLKKSSHFASFLTLSIYITLNECPFLLFIWIYILPIMLLQADLIYENGVMLSAKVIEILDTLTSDPSGDRLYINNFFFAMFPEKYIKKQMKRGMNRSSVLKKFRDSKRHRVMKGEP